MSFPFILTIQFAQILAAIPPHPKNGRHSRLVRSRGEYCSGGVYPPGSGEPPSAEAASFHPEGSTFTPASLSGEDGCACGRAMDCMYLTEGSAAGAASSTAIRLSANRRPQHKNRRPRSLAFIPLPLPAPGQPRFLPYCGHYTLILSAEQQ